MESFSYMARVLNAIEIITNHLGMGQTITIRSRSYDGREYSVNSDLKYHDTLLGAIESLVKT